MCDIGDVGDIGDIRGFYVGVEVGVFGLVGARRGKRGKFYGVYKKYGEGNCWRVVSTHNEGDFDTPEEAVAWIKDLWTKMIAMDNYMNNYMNTCRIDKGLTPILVE